MRQTTVISAAGGLLILALLVVVLVTGVSRKARLDASARELAIAVTEMALTEGAEALVNNAHPRLLEDQTETQLAGYLGFANRRLGFLERILNISGESRVALLPFSAAPTSNFVILVQFAETQADIEVAMQWEQERWQITAFVIQTERLYE